MDKLPISVFLIVKDEEKNIEKALSSAAFADEIIVVDTGSIDGTVNAAKKYTSKVYSYPWQGFGRMKEIAKNLCSNKWVFTMDADEIISEGLKNYLTVIFNNKTADNFDAYEFSTKIFFKNKWRKCLGPYPGYKTRLFNKDKGKFTLEEVFESVAIQGRTVKVKKDILHYQYEDEYDYFEKMEKYSALAAYEINKKSQAAAAQKKLHARRGYLVFSKIDYSVTFKIRIFLKMLLAPPLKFIKKYFLYKACFEGKDGLLLSYGLMYYTFLKYFKTFKIKTKKDLFPLDPQKTRNLLIRMPNWLGDIIMALPALYSFAGYFQNVHILAPEKYYDFFKLLPFNGEIIKYSAKEAARFVKEKNGSKETRIDAALLFTNSFSSAYELYKTKLPVYGYNTDSRRIFLKNAVHLNKKYKKSHMIDFYGNLYNRMTFKRYNPALPSAVFNDELIQKYKTQYPKNLIGVSLCAKYGKTKIYGAQDAARLIEILKEKNNSFEFALLGTEDERGYYDEIEKSVPFKVYNLAGEFNLYEYAHFLKSLKYIIASDSGAMHIAAFAGVSGTALFFSTAPEHTSPLSDGFFVLSSALPCSPCFDKECRYKHYRCLKEFTPQKIAGEVMKKMI